VIAPFAADYAKAETPVPCVAVQQLAQVRIAPRPCAGVGGDGRRDRHYARVACDPATGRHLLLRPKDRRKDQDGLSLAAHSGRSSPRRVSRWGELTKEQVRDARAGVGLVTADKAEKPGDVLSSPTMTIVAFLRRRAPTCSAGPDRGPRGGRVLGTHDGSAANTGRPARRPRPRRGRPLLVIDLDPDRNAVRRRRSGPTSSTRGSSRLPRTSSRASRHGAPLRARRKSGTTTSRPPPPSRAGRR